MKKNRSASFARVGMSKDVTSDTLSNQDYSFAINMSSENQSGNIFKLKSEQSNLLASKFKEGYKVIGFESDINTGTTYFFLTNPDTGVSEVGFILDNANIDLMSDLEKTCGSCNFKKILSEPLENSVQAEYLTYVTLLEDSCNKCLNFDIRYPIKRAVIKNEKTGIKIFFTDNLNPPRYIDLNRLEEYLYTGEIVCNEDNTETTCLACDKLRMFPLYTPIRIAPEEIVLGGNLPSGQYSFYAAYSNSLGDETSEYTSLTNPIDIFDLNNRILSNEEQDDNTSYAIKLRVNQIDKDSPYYKIAVAFSNTIDGGTRMYEVGLFSNNTETVTLTTLLDKKEISQNQLDLPNPNIKLLEGLAESSDYLFGYGITKEEEWNLQPVVNLMGGFFKWQTHIATEDLYNNGVNNSLYKSYMRDEVYPLAISFVTNTGYRTARFPLIGRPPTATDLEIVDNLDTQSIIENINSCSSSGRTQRWQFYNTASVIGTCDLDITAGNFTIGERYTILFLGTTDFTLIGANSNEVGVIFTATGVGEGTGIASLEIPVNTVVEPVTKVCIISDIIAPAGNFTIFEVENFTTVNDYINNLLKEGYCEAEGSDIEFPFCGYTRLDSYPNCTPEFNDCNNITLVEEFIRLVDIQGEGSYIKNYVAFPDDYYSIDSAISCKVYELDSSGNAIRDTEFEQTYIGNNSEGYRVFNRVQRNFNTNPSAAETLVKIEDLTNPLNNTYYHEIEAYEGVLNNALNLRFTNLPTESTSGLIPKEFYSNLHKQALWFKVDTEGELEGLILELTKLKTEGSTVAITVGSNKIRLSIFTSSRGGDPIYSSINDLKSDGVKLLLDLDIDQNTLKIKETDLDVGTAPIEIPRTLYISVEVPLYYSSLPVEGAYISIPLSGCFSITTRPLQVDTIDVSYGDMTFEKVQRYEAECSFEVPVASECKTNPYKHGEFAYWHSEEAYPDNNELFNSKTLNINTDDFSSVELASEFRQKYGTSIDSKGNILLKDETDFTCEKIRHFKFPDNAISPFMYNNNQVGFAKSIIYPLGVTIDENVINDFLNIAVNNNLITEEQRKSIVSYELFRGDRTVNRSIVAKGLLYDMYKYKERQKEILFSNFPYNDLGDNKLFYDGDSRATFLKHPFNSDSNYNFTFHSPDTDFYKPTNPTEMKVEGYSFGTSKGVFNEVKDHPKYVILGRDAKQLAKTLATAEVLAELAVLVAQSAEVYRVEGGLSFSFNIPGIVLNVAVLATNAIGAAIFKYGRYKYQWLETFRNLGSPENFAYYYTSVGDYNYTKILQTENQSLRSIVKSTYLDSNRFTIVNEGDGETLEVNNVDRERSLFINIGKDFPLTYPEEYKGFDNHNIDFSNSSRFVQSSTIECTSGRSKEFKRRIASPYVSLKTYLPSQYGGINNIDWLTTSYHGDLKNPDNSCLKIFGGDTFISRHSLKRKVPMFLDNSLELASLTPFNYRAYSNLGDQPTYFINYLSPDELTIDRGMPNISTQYSLDCLTGDRDFYVKNPSKFYLFYYGIPSFLTETNINTNYRTAKPDIKESFYPLVGDYAFWTQEKNVSIEERNYYNYNTVHSNRPRISIGRTLPSTYNKEMFSRTFQEPNGLIFSLPDNNEADLTEPWLTFRPFDKYEFASSNGKLIELRGIESQSLLARFTNTTMILNNVSSTIDDGSTPETQNMGTGLRRRPRTFSATDLGYEGTQSFNMVSNEYGHFWVDAKRGQIFHLPAAGAAGTTEISAMSGGKPSGMKNWFKEHLPFKVLNDLIENYQDIDVDNPYNGIGIVMGWDSRYRRVFITKKDYKPLKPLKWACGGFYNANEQDYVDIITQYQNSGYTYEGIEECKLKFTKTISSQNSDIYAFFDTTSMQLQDGIDASLSLKTWFSEYQGLNPEYQGSLYIIPYSNERWVSFGSKIKQGDILPTGGSWAQIATLPPNLNNPSWVAPTNVVILAFVDESNSEYHSNNLSDGFYSGGIVQPTSEYTSDFNQHVIDIQSFEYFRAILYPIVQDISGLGGALVLQGLAAIEGRLLSSSDISNTQTTVDISLLQTDNPYIPIGALKDYGWLGVWNKVSPASSVFNSEGFSDELTNLIWEQGSQLVEYESLNPIELTNSEYFEDVSYTLAYSLSSGSWLSFYDFKPNYYVNHNNYFQTGLNVAVDNSELGLWSHLVTNKSYSVFYGKKYEVGLEFPIINNFTTKTLESVEIWTEALRYHNDYDFAFNRDISFNKMFVHNHRESTGYLKLVPQKTLRDIRNYPKTNGNYQEILMTNSQDRWKLNYLYNRVSSEYLNQPIWSWDTNQIKKTLNNNLIKFKGKKVLERMKGNFFLVNLGYDLDTRFEITFNWATFDEELN